MYLIDGSFWMVGYKQTFFWWESKKKKTIFEIVEKKNLLTQWKFLDLMKTKQKN